MPPDVMLVRKMSDLPVACRDAYNQQAKTACRTRCSLSSQYNNLLPQVMRHIIRIKKYLSHHLRHVVTAVDFLSHHLRHVVMAVDFLSHHLRHVVLPLDFHAASLTARRHSNGFPVASLTAYHFTTRFLCRIAYGMQFHIHESFHFQRFILFYPTISSSHAEQTIPPFPSEDFPSFPPTVFTRLPEKQIYGNPPF